MVLGMSAPPVVAKPQPKPQLKVEQHPIPEFMWCQRSDRVYVTIKVSDCKNARVNVTADNVLEFAGSGSGMCGVRDYELHIQLFGAVVPGDCGWFATGPGVRVRRQKEKVGPYWDKLLAGSQKMVHCKVDWASWLDEDEETEVSRAPNGFDVESMCFNMMGESDALYRDPNQFESSESEGEEENSVMMDEGMNSLDDMQARVHATSPLRPLAPDVPRDAEATAPGLLPSSSPFFPGTKSTRLPRGGVTRRLSFSYRRGYLAVTGARAGGVRIGALVRRGGGGAHRRLLPRAAGQVQGPRRGERVAGAHADGPTRASARHARSAAHGAADCTRQAARAADARVERGRARAAQGGEHAARPPEEGEGDGEGVLAGALQTLQTLQAL